MEKILIIDFSPTPLFPSPVALQILSSLRALAAYSELISAHYLTPFTPTIKALILIGSPSDESIPLNLDSIEIPILGIQGGAIQLALSFHAQFQATNSNSNSLIREQNRILLANDPLLIGLKNCHYVPSPSQSHIGMGGPMTNITDSSDIVSLMMTEHCNASGFKIARRPYYGLQYCPEPSSLIWRNFVHLSHIPLTWTMAKFLSEVIPELRVKLGFDQVLLYCSYGLKSVVLALLLKHAIGSSQLKCIHVDNGMSRRASDTNSLRLLIPNLEVVTTRPSNVYKYVASTALYLEKEAWGGNIKPLVGLLREEVQQLGFLLGLSAKFVYQYPFTTWGMKGNNIPLLQQIDELYIDFLRENYYYGQLKNAGVSWIAENVVSLWAYDLEGNVAALPIDKLQEVFNKVGVKVVYEIR